MRLNSKWIGETNRWNHPALRVYMRNNHGYTAHAIEERSSEVDGYEDYDR